MDQILALFTLSELLAAFAVTVLAGVIKGAVGFAMPMIMISGLGMFLSPELALAGLILPTALTNGQQALRQGLAAAIGSMKRFRVFLLAGLVFLLISAQLIRFLEPGTYLLVLGIPVTFFALLQLLGLRLKLSAPSLRIEAGVGALAGFIGGVSGVWGPPTVMYLTALDTPKGEQIRVQGVIYGLGAIALLVAHIGSGVLNADTWRFSAVLIVPAMAGMWVGSRLHDRIDQATFRKATLLVLLIAGLNLVRRGVLV